jgi:hypothetical protein
MRKEEKELEKSSFEIIEGEFINIRQSTVRSVEGGHVELQQVGAFSIDAERMEVTQGAAVILRGNDISLNQSISAITAGENVSTQFSLAPVSLSKEHTEVNKSAVGLLIAPSVRAESTSALFVVANKVEGNITTLLDCRSALVLGAALGGLLGFFTLLRRK